MPSPPIIPQAAAIPCRVVRGSLRVALVSSSDGGRWVVPKGGIDRGETIREAAVREAEEEAGVTGNLSPRPIGRYSYEKFGRRYRVTVYVLRVRHAWRSWPESDLRERRWLSVEAAAELVPEPELAQLILKAAETVSE